MRNEFYNAIRRHIEISANKTGFGGSLTAYQIGEDEIHDASLVSLRVYQTRVHSDIVRLACGVSFAHEPLPQKLILLPSLNAIVQISKKYGVKHA